MRTPEIEAALAWADGDEFIGCGSCYQKGKVLGAALRQAEAELARHKEYECFQAYVRVEKERDLALAQLGDAREALTEIEKAEAPVDKHGNNSIESLRCRALERMRGLAQHALSRTPANEPGKSTPSTGKEK